MRCDGPGRAAAHDMWALYGPLCPTHEAAHVFTVFYGPARTAAHEMWGITATTTYYDVHCAHEAAHVF